MERFSISSLDPALLDLRAWPSGNLDKLADKDLASYESRQRAVELVLQGEPDERIRTKCGMSRQMAVYLLRRCLHTHRYWILRLLAERYVKSLTCFRLIYKQHDRFSEALFLSELLGMSGHKYPRGISKKIMMDRLIRLFAIRARNRGGHQILLLIDEAQNMHEPEYQTLCNLENELDQMGFKLTVISVGSHELTYQHQVFVQTGKVHLMARYMVRSETSKIAKSIQAKLYLQGASWNAKPRTTKSRA